MMSRHVSAMLVALALLVGGVGKVQAGQYTFTYSDPSGDVGYGTLTVVPSGLGDDSLWATSGSLTVTSSANSDIAVGTYSLLAAGPTVTNSAGGLFIVDNLIYPANDAGSGVNNGTGGLASIPNPSYLDEGGLLFGPPGTGSQEQINIWGNGGANNYEFGSAAGGADTIIATDGTFTLTAVPEPSTVSMAAAAICVGIAYGWSRGRKRDSGVRCSI